MKKLLLSSIIMFGICGFVTAQNATDSKLKKASTTTTASAAPTPQKSAVAAPALTTTTPQVRTVADKMNAASAAPVATGKNAKAVKTDANALRADGTVIAADDLQTKETAKPVAPVQKN